MTSGRGRKFLAEANGEEKEDEAVDDYVFERIKELNKALHKYKYKKALLWIAPQDIKPSFDDSLHSVHMNVNGHLTATHKRFAQLLAEGEQTVINERSNAMLVWDKSANKIALLLLDSNQAFNEIVMISSHGFNAKDALVETLLVDGLKEVNSNHRNGKMSTGEKSHDCEERLETFFKLLADVSQADGIVAHLGQGDVAGTVRLSIAASSDELHDSSSVETFRFDFKYTLQTVYYPEQRIDFRRLIFFRKAMFEMMEANENHFSGECTVPPTTAHLTWCKDYKHRISTMCDFFDEDKKNSLLKNTSTENLFTVFERMGVVRRFKGQMKGMGMKLYNELEPPRSLKKKHAQAAKLEVAQGFQTPAISQNRRFDPS